MFCSLVATLQEFIDKPASMKLVKAWVPLAEMFQYVSVLRGMTKGRAQYSMQLERYEVVPPNSESQETPICCHTCSPTGCELNCYDLLQASLCLGLK